MWKYDKYGHRKIIWFELGLILHCYTVRTSRRLVKSEQDWAKYMYRENIVHQAILLSKICYEFNIWLCVTRYPSKKKIKALCWLTIYNLLRGIMTLDKCCQANGHRSPIITPPPEIRAWSTVVKLNLLLQLSLKA